MELVTCMHKTRTQKYKRTCCNALIKFIILNIILFNFHNNIMIVIFKAVFRNPRSIKLILKFRRRNINIISPLHCIIEV